MLQDKKSDTDAEKQKALLRRMVERVSSAHPDLYYQSTSDVARLIADEVAEGRGLNADERALMARLSPRDIQVMLSLH